MTVVSKVQLLSDEGGKLKDALGFSTATALLSEHRLHVMRGVISRVGYSGKLVVTSHQPVSFEEAGSQNASRTLYIGSVNDRVRFLFFCTLCHFTLTRRVSLLLFDFGFGHAIQLP